MPWEYKVLEVGAADHPYHPIAPQAAGLEAMLQELGKEGWELVHVRDIPGQWRSDPETFPGGDPGRHTWDYGRSLFYLKRQRP